MDLSYHGNMFPFGRRPKGRGNIGKALERVGQRVGQMSEIGEIAALGSKARKSEDNVAGIIQMHDRLPTPPSGKTAARANWRHETGNTPK